MKLEKTYQKLLVEGSTSSLTPDGVTLPVFDLENHAFTIFDSGANVWLNPNNPKRILLTEDDVNHHGNLQILMGCGFCLKAANTLAMLSMKHNLTFQLTLRKTTPAPVFVRKDGKELIGSKNANIYLKFINNAN